MKISFTAIETPKTGTLVVGVSEGRELTPTAKAMDAVLKGQLARAAQSNRFKGKLDQSVVVTAPANGELDRVVLVGLGAPNDLQPLALQKLGGSVYSVVAPYGPDQVYVALDALDGCPVKPAEMAAHFAFGARVRSYRFDRYFTKQKDDEQPRVGELTVGCVNPSDARKRFQPMDKVADAIDFTRDITSEPANVIHPESLADKIKKLDKFGLEIDILGEKEMKKLGMGALLGVGQGSARESQLAVMQWWGAGKPDDKSAKGKKSKKDENADTGPLAFVGKGVTFDTGGISIKPSANMEDMKWDMAGSATVIGLMRALAARKAKVNAVGVVGLVENMPSGSAQRPGDVVTSMSGQTIEVINTDAEGRLVLADALWYTKDRFKPRLMIDLATLTGAIIIALGNDQAGVFSNNDEIAQRLTAAGLAVDEPVWRLPMGDAYDKMIKSDIADMKNVGNRAAGSITAAQFLQRFVDDTPWAHLDIAGVAWSKSDKGMVPKGATAFGVRLLDRFVADYYEDK